MHDHMTQVNQKINPAFYLFHLPAQRSSLVLIISLLLFLLLISHKTQASYLPLLLQSEAAYQQQTSHPDVVIIDTRSPEAYSAGHIKGAINLPITQLHETQNHIKERIIGPLKFQQVVEQAGIRKQDRLIFYSGTDPLVATRAFWTFEFYGHPSNSILDGGYSAWVFQGLPVDSNQVIQPPSQYTIELNTSRLASKFNTLVATQTNDTLLIDARPKIEFEGGKTRGKRLGHIPTAVNLEFSKVFNTRVMQTGEATYSTFIKTDEIKKLLSRLPNKKNIILYCNTGDEASALYFAFRLINKDAALYEGSWVEWSADKYLPIASSLTSPLLKESEAK
ncbi:MAG: thiosulfate/3-mercaptopyruvate sulfurtransferase [Thiomicrorhabdus sp.]|nr:MAG: thiosulfate/3-mercaptopyruvate sulfurtransferase [Thiomicrorhabdus sp.]